MRVANVLLSLLLPAVLLFTAQADDTCSPPEPADPVTILETDGSEKGVLFTFFAPKAKIKVKPTKMVTTKNYNVHFRLTRVGNNYSVVLTRPITLSSILGNYASGKGFELVLTLTCMDSEYSVLTTFMRTVFVKPQLQSKISRQYNFMGKQKFRVLENATVGDYIEDLIGRIVSERKDFATMAVSFKAHNNSFSSRPHFIISENGSIYLNRPLNYTGVDSSYEMNVTAKGEKDSEANATLTFIIINVDNHSPYFKYECPACTDAHYEADLTSLSLGEIKTFRHGPIQATDADGEPLKFEFVGGSPPNFQNFLEIDSANGKLFLKKYLEELEIGLIDAVLKVTSVGNLPQLKEPVTKEDFSTLMLWIIDKKFDFNLKSLSTSNAARPFSDPRSIVGALVFVFLASNMLSVSVISAVWHA